MHPMTGTPAEAPVPRNKNFPSMADIIGNFYNNRKKGDEPEKGKNDLVDLFRVIYLKMNSG